MFMIYLILPDVSHGLLIFLVLFLMHVQDFILVVYSSFLKMSLS